MPILIVPWRAFVTHAIVYLKSVKKVLEWNFWIHFAFTYKFRPQEPQKIVEVAKKKVGKIEYDALWQNCEHFAAFCRYDEVWSKKVCFV